MEVNLEGGTWVKYQLDHQTRKYLFFQYKRTTTTAPEMCVPVTDATENNNTTCITLPATFELKQTIPSVQHTTFIEYIQTLDEWGQSVLEEVDMEVEEDELKELLQDNIHLFLVSDGGEIYELGYFGWVIGTHMDVLVTNKGHAP
eukprot:14377307-Ditylum_brightwellii.AAC.1